MLNWTILYEIHFVSTVRQETMKWTKNKKKMESDGKVILKWLIILWYLLCIMHKLFNQLLVKNYVTSVLKTQSNQQQQSTQRNIPNKALY